MIHFRKERKTDTVDIILSILKTYRPDTYLELGTQRGYVFNRAVQYVRKYAVGVDMAGFNRFSLDRFKCTGIVEQPNYDYYIYRDMATPSNVDKEVRLYQCTTDTFFTACVPASLPSDCLPFDVVFVDADHSYAGCLRDLWHALEVVRPITGLILVHDTYPTTPSLIDPRYCGEAWRALRDFAAEANCEVVTLPGPWAGMSIIRKLDTWRGNQPPRYFHWQE